MVLRNLFRNSLDKYWNVNNLKSLLKKLRKTGTTARKPGIGRRLTSRAEPNISAVNDLIFNRNMRQRHIESHDKL